MKRTRCIYISIRILEGPLSELSLNARYPSVVVIYREMHKVHMYTLEKKT